MFTKNVGTIDRTIRIVVGLALLLGFFMNMGASYSFLYLLGIIPLATGIFGSCGVYSLFGVNTCSLKK